MIRYKITDGYIIDVAGVVIVLHVMPKNQDCYNKLPNEKESFPHDFYIKKFKIGETLRGRIKWELWEGDEAESQYVFQYSGFSGDRMHHGYQFFVEDLQHSKYKDQIYTKMKTTSNGKGNWEEVWLFPKEIYTSYKFRPDPDKIIFNETLADNL